MRLLFILLSLFFFSVIRSAQDAIPTNVYTVNAQACDELIDPSIWIKKPLFIDSINLVSHDSMRIEEFSYLTGLFPHMHIDAAAIRYALMQLSRKKWYESFSFWIERKAQTVLMVRLEKRWLIEKIKISGPLFHKQQYLRHYGFDTASIFSEKKHKDGLHRVKTALHAQGLLNAHVQDDLVYDQGKRNVSIMLTVNPGSFFVADSIELHTHGLPNDAILREEMISTLEHVLVSNYATQKNAELATTVMQQFLQKRGFVGVHMKVDFKVNHKTKKAVAVCTLHGGSQIGAIHFLGNRFFSKDTLRDYLYDRLLPSAPAASWLLVNLLQDLYKKKGFFNARIVIHEKVTHSYMVHIVEGQRSVVKTVQILYSDESTDTKNKEEKNSFKSMLEKPFDEDRLHELQHVWIEEHKNKGFWDFSIEDTVLEHRDDGVMHIKIVGKKNSAYCIQRIDVEPYGAILHHPPVVAWRAQLPQCIGIGKIEELKTIITQYFYDQGFLYVQVDYTIQPDEDDPSLLTIKWHINPGEKVHFGKTIITGKTTVPFNMLQRLLPFNEGEVWDFKKISQASFRLRDLGVFETIRIYPDQTDAQAKEKNVLIHLIDDDPCEMRVRAGFQQVSKNYTFRAGSTYKVGGSLIYKNPFRAGDLVSFDADVTRFWRYVTATYNRPWIGGIPLYGIVKGYSNKYVQPIRIGDQQPLYYARQEGGLIGCSYRWDHGSFGINTGLELVETSHLSVDVAKAIDFEPLLIDEKIPYLFIEPSYFYETLDDKFDPFSGMMFVLTSKGLFSWKRGGVNFLKMLCEYSYFIPLWRGVFAIHNRCGHIFHKSIKNIMPIERFYLGGANSLRGYQPDLAPPLGVYNDNGKEKRVPQGGRTVVNASIEYRLPIKYGLGIVLFQDMGILLKDYFSIYTPHKRLLAATGFGLRYKTPIGPLRFDIGWKWHKEAIEDARYACFLTFGHAF